MGKAKHFSLRRGNAPIFPPGRDTMVLVLTWAASGVDAISYLGLGHVFTANMTGNAVLLGLAIGQGQGLAALRSIIALVGFAVGAALGAVIVEKGTYPTDWPATVTRAMWMEGIILAVFGVTWHLGARNGAILYALITLSALAMGIQSAAIRHLKVPGVATTYITGTLTSMVAEFTTRLYRWRISPLAADPTGQSVVLDVPQASRHHGARLQALVVLVYILAAVVSAFLQSRHSRLVTLSPLIAVGLVALNASLRHPRK
jgi:uncharacterized membrane protein YoaK (UPF0700 family)